MTLSSKICTFAFAALSVIILTSCSPNVENKNADVPNAETINEWRQAAEKGDVDAQYNLGVFYSQDDSVDKDMTEAVKWFRKAAELGHVEAQYRLGLCYDKGDGIEQDAQEAVK